MLLSESSSFIFTVAQNSTAWRYHNWLFALIGICAVSNFLILQLAWPWTFLNMSLKVQVHCYYTPRSGNGRSHVSSDLKDSSKLFSILFLLLLLPSGFEFPLFRILSDTDIIRCFHCGHSGGIACCLMVAVISTPFIIYDVEQLSYLQAT